MNRNVWKYLAAVSMLLDHIGYFLLPETSAVYWICRVLGRVAAPSMCYLMAEGYRFTGSRSRYALRLLIFAVISQPVFSWAFYGNPVTLNISVMGTLLLAFLALWFSDDGPIPANKTLMVGALVLFSSLGDWGVVIPVLVLLFYYSGGSRKKQEKIYLIAVLVFLG
ncbi:MAG: TraX family protein, partial [Eubacteriales bacterium]|nr:TraX family protein [Eubacteriales bacterium]